MAKKSDDVYQKAMGLAKSFATNFIELGAYLRFLQENDHDRFNDFIKATTIGKRKAYYLVAVSKAFENLPVPKAKLTKLGWTKASLIQPTVTPENAQELVEFALSHSAADLKRHLKGEEVLGDSKALLIYFKPEDFELLAEAMIEHGGVRTARGVDNKEEALLNIVKALKAKK